MSPLPRHQTSRQFGAGLFAVLILLASWSVPASAAVTATIDLDDGSWTFIMDGGTTLTTGGPTPELLWATDDTLDTSNTGFTFAGDVYTGLDTENVSGNGTAYITVSSGDLIGFSLEFDDLTTEQNGTFLSLTVTPTGTFGGLPDSGTFVLPPYEGFAGNPSLTVAVPEPAASALAGVALLALIGRRRRA